MKTTFNMSEEYSERFDKIRKNAVELSYYKYGPVRKNYREGNIQAIPSCLRAIDKYKETGNTEYLCDAANYLMFEFMFPQIKGARYIPTSEAESSGIVGISVMEMEELKSENY